MTTISLQVHQGQVGPVDPDPGAPELPGGAAQVVRFFMEMPPWVQIWGAVLGGVVALILLIILWRRRAEVRGWMGAIWAWVMALPMAVKAAALALIVAAVAAGGVVGYQVYDFVEHDNRFCTGCHLMAEAYVSFEESAHAELGCKECHYQSKAESMRQLYLWVTHRPDEVPPHSPVPDAMCTSCHIDEDPENWPQIAASMGHRVHFESDDPDLGELMCVTCHGVSVHEFEPADATCGECHEAESEIRLGRMTDEAGLHCVACHDFLGDQPSFLPGVPEGMALLPDRAHCNACHEMSGLIADEELDVDPHGAVCGACHNPHTQETPEQALETCMGCHEDVETITVFHTGTHAPVLPDCLACHQAHRWEVQGTDCLACHETIMEERAQVIPGGYGAPPMAPAVPSGSAPWRALPVHGAPSHQRAPPGLGGVALPRPGSHPYGDLTTAPDTLPPPPGTSRPFLHRQHPGVSCTECHGTAVEHGVVTVRTARECAACHHDTARGYDCADCHEGADLTGPWGVSAPMDLTVWETVRARTLPFDHELHDGMACQECHTGPVMLEVEITCAACHDDHHRVEADCTQCHVPAEEGVHGLEVHLTCTSSGCHAGTAGERPTLSRSMCLACHADQRDHEPGLSCHGCHRVPEEPPVPGTTRIRGAAERGIE